MKRTDSQENHTLSETASLTTAPASRIPSYPRLIAIVYGVCVAGMSCSIIAEMIFGYTGSGDQPRSLGEQLAGVIGFGTAGLVVSVLAVRTLGTPNRRSIGAIVFGVLAVPALAFFWCGMPGMMGAAAAALAGLTREREPLAGTPRIFGLIGLVFAIANPVVNTLGVTISWLASG